MAFLLDNFSPVGAQSRRGAAPQMFSYKSADTLATIVATGYFNELRKQVEVNDSIMVASSTGGTVAFTLIFFATVPKAPSAVDLTISALDINAA